MAVQERAGAAGAVQPPVTERITVLAWLKHNLFSTWYNGLLTILVGYLLYLVLVPLFRWAVLDATVSGTSTR